MDDKIKKAREIVELSNAIDYFKDKLEFVRTGRYSDEFYLAYSQDDKFSEHTIKTKLAPRDIQVLRELWTEELHKLEKELEVLL